MLLVLASRCPCWVGDRYKCQEAGNFLLQLQDMGIFEPVVGNLNGEWNSGNAPRRRIRSRLEVGMHQTIATIGATNLLNE